ncbi:MAG: hypothetical protein IKW83_09255 [Muribaculaceae bacterium]|nr:hypothetical protein [Muribaculaceae bacterium]
MGIKKPSRSVMLLLCFIALVFCSCKSPSKSPSKSHHKKEHDKEFIDGLKQANKSCPIEIAGGAGTIDAVKLEDDYVTFYASYKQSASTPLLNDDNKERLKEVLVTALLSGRSNIIVDMMIDEGCGLKMVATKDNVKKTTVVIPLDELKEFRDNYRDNPQVSARKSIEIQVEAEKAVLPLKIEEGMTMTDYILEDDYVVFVIEINESLYSINTFKQNKEIMKSAIINEGLRERQAQILVNMCKSANMGIIYRMIGNKSKNIFDIVISCDELL